MSLAAFFEQVPALLRGERDVVEVESVLGPSPSSTADLDFYRRLHARHLLQRMDQLFSSVATVVRREDAAAWTALVEAFVEDHPPSGWSTHGMAAPFADWLAAREDREDAAALGALADWQRARWVAANAPDGGDGVGTRVAARAYDVDVVAWHAALRKDPAAPCPEGGPVLVLLYRHLDDHGLRTLTPTALTLAVLSRRAGEPLPDALAAHGDALDAEEDRLVRRRALPALSGRGSRS